MDKTMRHDLMKNGETVKYRTNSSIRNNSEHTVSPKQLTLTDFTVKLSCQFHKFSQNHASYFHHKMLYPSINDH